MRVFNLAAPFSVCVLEELLWLACGWLASVVCVPQRRQRPHWRLYLRLAGA